MVGRLAGGRAPALVSLLVLLGVLPVLLLPAGLPAAMVSAVVFGSSFMAGPTAATVLARRALPASGWTAGIALLTVAFSVGQAVGPLLSGLLADSGGVEVGLWLSVGLLAAAGLVALRQRDPAPAAAPASASRRWPPAADRKAEPSPGRRHRGRAGQAGAAPGASASGAARPASSGGDRPSSMPVVRKRDR
ncbi:MFS transporter [Micromonospora sp. 4G55]|uniref:MFS transporter n=1 Tax=Micromonospora sp. 4G55 TaxID=2806102 RepID=UPI0035C739AD